MTLPIQPDEIQAGREAVAPYNFVSLPEKIVTVKVADLPDQGKFHADRLTGYIDCELTTESPVFVRAGVTPEQVLAGKQSKDLPDFFYLNDKNEPVIPGSSLRGVIRTLVEIVTYSKLSFVSDKKMVYRSVGGATNHDAHYRDMMMCYEGERDRKKYYVPLIKGGYMVKKGKRDWAIRPAKEVDGTTYAHIRIDEPLFKSLRKIDHAQNASVVYVRTSPYDYQDVRGGFLKIKYARVLEAKASPAPGLRPGTLAQSGWMNSKRTEAVIYEANPDDSKLLELTDDQIDAYTEQISQEQKKLLGENGVLNDGQPVFYITDQAGKVVFFGHARMFRVPYPKSPFEFVPETLRKGADDEVDMAEAIFGYTRQQGKGRQRAYAGRVSFGDAYLLPGQSQLWLNDGKPIHPKILSGPKPTTFQHYLVQIEPDEYKVGATRDGKPKFETRLRDYASPTPKETVLRGTKFYWHKGPVTQGDIEKQDKSKSEDVLTEITPLRAGVRFNFRVNFENLSNEELGALLFVLDVLASSEKTRIKLGMGKPLGMGSVKITPSLFLENVRTRYSSLLTDDSNWRTGIKQADEHVQKAVSDFRAMIARDLDADLLKLVRIRELIFMLQWPGPNCEMTRYMEIPAAKSGKPNEYKNRPVLPTPFGVWGNKNNKKVQQEYQKQKEFLDSGRLFGIVEKIGLGPNGSQGYIKIDNTDETILFLKNSISPMNKMKLQVGQRVSFLKRKSLNGDEAVDVQL